ncbi:very short patch repair endonuclease [Mesorhizobium sp. M0142]|uniref:very short patch repair endonuclease n=1 Tax=Mesorhizobium sp. M0142 TaxID=2956894 RepID=UPI00333736EC
MDTLSPEARSERMRRVRSCDTKPEVALRRLIWGLGYRYRKNQRGVTGQPDIVFKLRKRAIFLHGCFWHRHNCPSGQRVPKSRLDFWNQKFRANTTRDEVVARQLEADGWRSLVVWECELSKPAVVTDRVKEFLNA